MLTSAAIIAKAGVYNVCKTNRCKTLKELGKVKVAQRKPPISERYQIKRLNWARKYMKLDFNKVIFMDECRTTLDGPRGTGRRPWQEVVFDFASVFVILCRIHSTNLLILK